MTLFNRPRRPGRGSWAAGLVSSGALNRRDMDEYVCCAKVENEPKPFCELKNVDLTVRSFLTAPIVVQALREIAPVGSDFHVVFRRARLSSE
jgi:hypothetical protein